MNELKVANRGKFVRDDIVVDLDTVIWTALRYWWEQSSEDEAQLMYLYHVYDVNMDGHMDFHVRRQRLAWVNTTWS